MLDKKDIGTLGFLSSRFLAPHYGALALIITINLALGFLVAIRPLTIAPLLSAVMGDGDGQAQGVGDLTLNNISPILVNLLATEGKGIFPTAVTVAGVFVLISGMIACALFLGGYLLSKMKTSIESELTSSLHKHLLTLNIQYFYRQKTGDLVSQLNYDVGATSGAIATIARGLVTTFSQVIVASILLVRTDPLLTLIVVTIGVSHFVITKALTKRIRYMAKDVVQSKGDVSAGITESIQGMKIIKTFCAQSHEHEHVARLIEKFRDRNLKIQVIGSWETAVRFLVNGLLIGGILVAVFFTISEERLTLPGAALFLILSQQLTEPVSTFFGHILRLQDLLGRSSRIVETLRTTNPIEDGGKEAAILHSEIRLDQVSFAYDTGPTVVQDISFTIRRGEMVALVGASGVGKSTIADLVLRLYDIHEGRITYDGVDIRKFKKNTYRKQFGFVSQDCLLFNETIKNNILLGRAQREEDLRHALWAANALDLVESLPEGIETMVGERGVMLSGGQRQRVAIARAVYSRPSILVLDEATSALDAESETAVQRAINRISKEITMLVIAHRLATIVHATKIVLIHQGKVEAIGTHEKLLVDIPRYRKLYELQFRRDLSNLNLV